MSASIIAIGTSTLDRVWFVDALPAAGGKLRAHGYLEVGGGQAANAAVTAARLGGQVELWSVVGSDAAGVTILDQLRAEHVGVDGTAIIDGARSVTAGILVDNNGERTIVSDFDARLHARPPRLDLARIAKAGAVVSDVRWVAAAEPALREARRLGVPTVLDIEPAPAESHQRLCPLADHAIFGQAGLAAYTGTANVEQGLRIAFERLGGVVGVTLGSAGVRLMTRDQTVYVPAPLVSVVDTTGAGDAFHGAYALAIAEGQEIVAAARFANAVAAMKCAKPGGRAGLPTRAEVDRFMATGA